MNILGIGPMEMLVIFLLAFLILGPDRMMEVARGLRKGLSELRKLTAELPDIKSELSELSAEMTDLKDEVIGLGEEVTELGGELVEDVRIDEDERGAKPTETSTMRGEETSIPSISDRNPADGPVDFQAADTSTRDEIENNPDREQP